MKTNPDKYKTSISTEKVKVNWTYNKIMLTHGQIPTSTLTPEMIAKLKSK